MRTTAPNPVRPPEDPQDLYDEFVEDFHHYPDLGCRVRQWTEPSPGGFTAPFTTTSH